MNWPDGSKDDVVAPLACAKNGLITRYESGSAGADGACTPVSTGSRTGTFVGASLAGLLFFTVIGLVVVARAHAAEIEKQRPKGSQQTSNPRQLYLRDCAFCHGADGSGTSRAPSIRESGPAQVHFMLTTGYMPLEDESQRMRRKQPNYTDEEIEELTEHISTFVTGPEVEEVEVKEKEVSHGGELFRFHCASCHQLAGVGGVLVGSRPAPTLHYATAQEVVEALRTGPGTMPAFSEKEIGNDDAKAIASYVVLELQNPRDDGGIAAGHTGPFSEGLVIALAGLLAIVVGCMWIGERE